MGFSLGSIASGVGSFLGSAGGSNLLSIPLQYYYNKKLASKQNDYNMSAWQANNDYNSPVNSLARLREAGLNPNLYYGGSGASVAGRSGSPAPMTAGQAPNVIQAVSEAVKASLQNRQVEAAELKLGQDVLESKSRALLNMEKVRQMSGTYDLTKRHMEKQIERETRNIGLLTLAQKAKLHDLRYAQETQLPVGQRSKFSDIYSAGKSSVGGIVDWYNNLPASSSSDANFDFLGL